MTAHRRKGLLVGIGVVVLIVLNLLVLQKEQLRSSGTRMLLELDVHDERSLLQGFYMKLRYVMPAFLMQADSVRSGRVVVFVEDSGRATIRRLYREGEALQDGEHLLRYRRRGGQVWLGSRSYFFQEGQAPAYGQARYGELKVGKDGESVFIGLRDEALRELPRETQ